MNEKFGNNGFICHCCALCLYSLTITLKMSEEKYLNIVTISSDVYSACFQHALSTEKEEIMGLLIGEVDEIQCKSVITACVILHRSDKQPDRVEISPEQLYYASQYADELARKLEKPMRVLGWYHSHPHITVWPSHVDVRTQVAYQVMDPFFVGLIFSVYQNDTGSRANHVQFTCFQAVKVNSDYERREVAVEIVNMEVNKHILENVTTLPKILFQENQKNDKEENCNSQLSMLQKEAAQTLSLVHIVATVAKPLCEQLEARLRSVNLRIKQLEKLKEIN